MLPRIDFRNARAVPEIPTGSGIPAPAVPRDRASIKLAEAFFHDPGVAADSCAGEECPCFSA